MRIRHRLLLATARKGNLSVELRRVGMRAGGTSPGCRQNFSVTGPGLPGAAKRIPAVTERDTSSKAA